MDPGFRRDDNIFGCRAKLPPMKRPRASLVFSTSWDNAVAGQGWEADMAETRIGVIGCAGRVGRMLIADIVAAEGCALAGGVARPGSTAVGQDLGELAGLGPVATAAAQTTEGETRDRQ